MLTESLGDLKVTATEKGYKIVEVETGQTKAEVKEPYTNCAATNMQRAMLRAHEIIEAKEKAKETADE